MELGRNFLRRWCDAGGILEISSAESCNLPGAKAMSRAAVGGTKKDEAAGRGSATEASAPVRTPRRRLRVFAVVAVGVS